MHKVAHMKVKATKKKLLSFLSCILLVNIRLTTALRKPLKNHLRSHSLRHAHDVLQSPELYATIVDNYDFLKDKHSIELTGLIYGIGDALVQIRQQMLLGKEDGEGGIGIDFRRLLVFTLVGSLFVAPIVGNWFKVLDTIPALLYGKSVDNLLKSFTMVAIDQTIASVVILTLFFYAYEFINSLLPPYHSNNSLKTWYTRSENTVRNTLWDTLCANWRFWPMLNFFIFTQVPLESRLIASSIAAIFWNMYLSQKAHLAIQKDPLQMQP